MMSIDERELAKLKDDSDCPRLWSMATVDLHIEGEARRRSPRSVVADDER